MPSNVTFRDALDELLRTWDDEPPRNLIVDLMRASGDLYHRNRIDRITAGDHGVFIYSDGAQVGALITLRDPREISA